MGSPLDPLDPNSKLVEAHSGLTEDEQAHTQENKSRENLAPHLT